MFGLIKKIFTATLASIVNVSDHTECISLKNQSCMTRPILIDLNPDEYNQGLHYYPFMVNLDRFNENFNTHDGLASRICVPNKIKDVNLSACNMTTKIKKEKKLAKHISCQCKLNLMVENVIQIKTGITINFDVTTKFEKTSCVQKNIYIVWIKITTFFKRHVSIIL